MSVTLTLLVRETAEDNQERTNDVLRTPCCVTFDHERTIDMAAHLTDACNMQQLLYRLKVHNVLLFFCIRKFYAYFNNLFKLKVFLAVCGRVL